jgi:DnaJ-class molecular chaperone
MTYYDILEVVPQASPEVIKNAYRALAKKYHPDLQTNENDRQWSEAAFKTITEAYEILSEIERRKNYDLWLNINNSEEAYEKEATFPNGVIKETETREEVPLFKNMDATDAIIASLIVLMLAVILIIAITTQQ